MIRGFISPTLFLALLPASLTGALAQIPPPQFSKTALLNGMEVFFLPNPEPRSHFVLMIQNGAAFDPAGKWGLTRLTVQSMLEKTERRTGDQLREDLALLGAELDARVEWDAIYFQGSAPPERLADALNVLAEVIVRPAFDEEVFESVRAEQLEEVRAGADDPGERTAEVFLRELFGLNPYGHTVNGTVQTLQSLLLNDLKIQYRKLFLPNQAQLAVFYSGDHTPLFSGMARSWGSWVRGEAAPFTFRRARAPDTARALVLDQPGTGQGLLRLGALSVPRSEPQFYDLKVLEQYLTLSLTDWAREVTSKAQIRAAVRLEAGRMPGFLQLTVQAPEGELVQYAFRFRDLLERLRNGEIDPDRFKEAKELAFLEMRRQLEDPRGLARQLLEVHLHGVGVSFLTTYGIRLQRVKPSRFQATLTELLAPSSLLLVAAGDGAFLKAQLEEWGRVRVLN